jgi:hypothetical protein
VAERETLFDAITAHLRQAEARGDWSSLLERGVAEQAQELTATLQGDRADPQVLLTLGWLHWYRHEAQPERQRQPDLDAAIAMLTPCFLTGIEPLPDPLLPILAHSAAPAAVALLREAAVSVDRRSISAAVDLWQRIVHATPLEDPERAAWLFNLGTALYIRYTQAGAPGDLDAAIDAERAAAEAIPTDDPDRASYLSNLRVALYSRFERSRALADLDEAVAVSRAAAEATPADHPDRASSLSKLAHALWIRFEHRRAPADLDEAIIVERAALEVTPSGHPDRARLMVNLVGALISRFERSEALADLEEAITTGRAAVEATYTDDPNRAAYLSNLASALQIRFDRTTALADLDETITATRAATEATPSDHPDRTRLLTNLGIALRTRFERTGAPSDLEGRVTVWRAAVETTPADNPDHAAYLSNLATALRDRFDRAHAPEDLEETITIRRAAVETTPAGHADRAGRLSNLATALWVRFERDGTLTDLDEMITATRAATEATPSDHPDRARLLTNLGIALRTRFERTGAPSDLEERVTVWRAAVDTTPADHPDRAGRLSNLAGALRDRFDRAHAPEDLQETITVWRAAVETTPADHADRAGRLSNLATVLQIRFEQGGSPEDLDAAVTARRAAVQATPSDHLDRAGKLSDLGAALHNRFERTGALADLEAAVTLERAAVEATPADHPDRANYLSNLIDSLRSRFERTKDVADLEEAISCGRTAVKATPVGHPGRRTALSNLGIALQSRFEHTKALPDLEEAITVGRAAMEATPVGHPNRAVMLSNWGVTLQARFQHKKAMVDLDEAVVNGRAAVEATSADHPDRGLRLSNLHNALETRYKHTQAVEDLKEAATIARAIVELVSAAPSVRIRAARSAAHAVADSDPAQAAAFLETAVRLLPKVAPRFLDRPDQEYALGGFVGLAGDAAALALSDTSFPMYRRAIRALSLLEAGRGLLLSQSLETHSDLTDLQREHPDVAAQFGRLRHLLDTTTGITGLSNIQDLAGGPAAPSRDRKALAAELTALLTRIRGLEGFASFALPPTEIDLLREGVHGPIVVINISRYRSDALLLTPNGVTVLNLSSLTPIAAINQINIFHRALAAIMDRQVTKQKRDEAQARINGVLAWLWDMVAGPVLNNLDFHLTPTSATWPRVWWVTGGLLDLLPIHAAGHHDDPPTGPGRRTVIDRVVSSYTPTIHALHYARRQAYATMSDSSTRALIVAMPTTPGIPGRLAYVLTEADRLRTRLPESVLLTEPDTLPAQSDNVVKHLPTKANVLTHLATCPIAHFACHGTIHPADPSHSMLLLHDYAADPFTVGCLASLHLDHVQLAFLSACATAVPPITKTDLLDEAINLTSAFQLAGYPQVIGTLWYIDDAIAARVTDAVYASLDTGHGTLNVRHAAEALHHATRSIRDQYPHSPTSWAAHIHAGA